MIIYAQQPSPATLPSGAVGQPYSQVIKMLPNVGSLQNILSVEGDTDGLTVVISNASENELTVSGTPLAAGTFPITITVMGTSGESKFTI